LAGTSIAGSEVRRLECTFRAASKGQCANSPSGSIASKFDLMFNCSSLGVLSKRPGGIIVMKFWYRRLEIT
jgi:hypothetical protein